MVLRSLRDDVKNLKDSQEGLNIEFNTFSSKHKKPRASEIDTLRKKIEA